MFQVELPDECRKAHGRYVTKVFFGGGNVFSNKKKFFFAIPSCVIGASANNASWKFFNFDFWGN